MYFLVFHAQPRPDLEDADDIAGAYISCWIEANSLRRAEAIARQEIGDAKWDIMEREEAHEIEADKYLPDSEGYEFYQQAKDDKYVFRFHTYPIE